MQARTVVAVIIVASTAAGTAGALARDGFIFGPRESVPLPQGLSRMKFRVLDAGGEPAVFHVSMADAAAIVIRKEGGAWRTSPIVPASGAIVHEIDALTSGGRFYLAVAARFGNETPTLTIHAGPALGGPWTEEFSVPVSGLRTVKMAAWGDRIAVVCASESNADGGIFERADGAWASAPCPGCRLASQAISSAVFPEGPRFLLSSGLLSLGETGWTLSPSPYTAVGGAFCAWRSRPALLADSTDGLLFRFIDEDGTWEEALTTAWREARPVLRVFGETPALAYWDSRDPSSFRIAVRTGAGWTEERLFPPSSGRRGESVQLLELGGLPAAAVSEEGNALWILRAIGPAGSEDCNLDLVPDAVDLATGASADCDGNEIPDECQIMPRDISFDWQTRRVERSPRSLVAADLDGDSLPDLALCGQKSLSIVGNAGSRSLGTARMIGLEDDPSSLVAADFDGDGHADLAATTSRYFLTFVNDGRGGFRRAERVNGSGMRVLAAADLDRDGDVDIAAGSSGSTRIHGNDGKGAFSMIGSSIVSCSGPQSLLPSDLDADGYVDLIGGGWPKTIPTVLQGRGDGTFLHISGIPSLVGPATAADIDGDGLGDVVGTDAISWNLGGLRFSEPQAHPVAGIPVVMDLDEDGHRDVLLGAYDGGVRFLRGIGGRALDEAAVFAVPKTIAAITAADLDLDGKPDVAVAREDDDVPPAVVQVFWNDGGGTLDAPHTVARTPDPPCDLGFFQILAADIDRNGMTDLVARGGEMLYGGCLTSFLGGGGFRFVDDAHLPYVNLAVSDLAWADIDGDGSPEVVLAVPSGDPPSSALQLLRAQPGSFKASRRIDGLPYMERIACGDFDGDGRIDVAGSGMNYGGAWSRGLGGGAFEAPRLAPFGLPLWSMRSVDLDGDGVPEIVSATPDGISAAAVDPTGALVARPLLPGEIAYSMAIADLDRDGTLDLARTAGLASIYIDRNDGRGALRRAGAVDIGNAFSIALIDADVDGRTDLAFVDDAGEIRFIANISPTPASVDCNFNRVPDACDIVSGASRDVKLGGPNGIPDECERAPFRRGDANRDGVVDISDGLCILKALFAAGGCGSGGAAPGGDCLESADANDDGAVDCSDPILVLAWLFLGRVEIAAPGPVACGLSPDRPGSPGDLGCDAYPGCP